MYLLSILTNINFILPIMRVKVSPSPGRYSEITRRELYQFHLLTVTWMKRSKRCFWHTYCELGEGNAFPKMVSCQEAPPSWPGQTLWFSLPRASLLLPFMPAVPGRLKAPGAYSLLGLYPYRQCLAQRGHSLNTRRMNQCPMQLVKGKPHMAVRMSNTWMLRPTWNICLW